MTLSRGTSFGADLKLFDSCNPVLPRSGRYTRSCTVPRVGRLFIGYGHFALTKRALEQDWKKTHWDLWLDGRRVNLKAFGTSDRTLVAFPAAGGKDVVLREWDLMLEHAEAGRHTLRYRSRSSTGSTDATWIFTVAGGG